MHEHVPGTSSMCRVQRWQTSPPVAPERKHSLAPTAMQCTALCPALAAIVFALPNLQALQGASWPPTCPSAAPKPQPGVGSNSSCETLENLKRQSVTLDACRTMWS